MSSTNTAPLYPRSGYLSSISSEAGLATVGYFNTDFGDQAKRSARGVLSSLLIQLCIQSDNFTLCLLGKYNHRFVPERGN